MSEALVGPVAALALALVILALFYTGKILPRNTVPREDHDALKEVNASYAAALMILTKSIDDFIIVVKLVQKKNGEG